MSHKTWVVINTDIYHGVAGTTVAVPVRMHCGDTFELCFLFFKVDCDILWIRWLGNVSVVLSGYREKNAYSNVARFLGLQTLFFADSGLLGREALSPANNNLIAQCNFLEHLNPESWSSPLSETSCFRNKLLLLNFKTSWNAPSVPWHFIAPSSSMMTKSVVGL